MKELYLIPYAGGTSLSYNKWDFADEIKVTALDYRGHGTRWNEGLDQDFHSVVTDICEEVLKRTSGNEIALFGHSMGALVAWDVANVLKRKGFTIKKLFVSACAAPNVFNIKYYAPLATETGVTEYIKREHRLNAHQLETTFFKTYIYPTIVNDYRILSEYKYEDICKSIFNITAFCGLSDPSIAIDDMKTWKEYTCTHFILKTYQGDHYFIENETNRSEIINTIENSLLS